MTRHQELPSGFIIADRYEVIKCLGTGSMGAVYACKHKELSGHIIAAKVLFPEVANDKVSAARFRNEIFASYGVSHPNVVRAYEYIKEKGIVAYTMEYVNGGDLADCLKSPSNLLSIERIVEILLQMTSGVQAIHDSGIIHRDLKPENILLTKSGNVKIADFGIARTERGPRLTEHGGIVGTIDYVSPEYMLNSQVDCRSDIYAIGILAYEMITGVTPFSGETVYDTMVARLKKDVEPPSLKRKECPSELDEIILRALKREPNERYQTAQEFNDDLRDFQKFLKGDKDVIIAHREQEKKLEAQVELEETERIREIIRKVQKNGMDDLYESEKIESVLSKRTINNENEVRDIEIKETKFENMNRLASKIKAKNHRRVILNVIKDVVLAFVLFSLLAIIVAFIEHYYPQYRLFDKIFSCYNYGVNFLIDKLQRFYNFVLTFKICLKLLYFTNKF